MGHRMTATVPSRYACYGRQTSNEYPAGFYSVGVGFELVACCRRAARPGRLVLVRFEHGVTRSVAMSDLQPRDLTSRGSDRPPLERQIW